jgi:hypothetical protein
MFVFQCTILSYVRVSTYNIIRMFLFQCTILSVCSCFNVQYYPYVRVSMYNIIRMFVFQCTILPYVLVSMYNIIRMFVFQCTILSVCSCFIVQYYPYVRVSIFHTEFRDKYSDISEVSHGGHVSAGIVSDILCFGSLKYLSYDTTNLQNDAIRTSTELH